jgi:4-amino-4-deoxy-L-arabinose transferase-like glycosyltransferase
VRWANSSCGHGFTSAATHPTAPGSLTANSQQPTANSQQPLPTLNSRSSGSTLEPLLLLIVGGLIFRGICAIWLPPGFDEVYYYLYSRHLDWSYFDHPVMVALTTGLGWWTTGVIAPFTIRIGALLSYTVSLLFLYSLGDRLFSARTGLLAVAIATLMPLLFLSFGLLTAPENGLILFWTAALYYAAVEFFPRGRSPRPYRPTYRVALIGLLVGLACISKYHGFVLGAGLVGFCLSHRRYRGVFTSPWMALSVGLFLFTLLPLLIWNLQQDWLSFRFHLSLRFEDNGLDAPESTPYSPLGVLVTWLAGVGYLFPTLSLPMWWVTLRSSWRQVLDLINPPWSDPYLLAAKRGLLLWVSLPTVVGFTLLGGAQAIYPGWPAPGFWGLLLLLAAYVEQWERRSHRAVQRWLWGTGLFLAGLMLLALSHLSLGTLQRPSQYALFGGVISAAEDGSTDLFNIGQMRRQFGADPDLMAALEDVAFVFTNEYYLSAYVDMALYPLVPLPVTAFSQDPRGFAIWFRDQQPWIGQDALYITLARFDQDPEILANYEPLFSQLEPLTEIPLTRGGMVVDTLHVYQARDFQQAYVYPYP